MELQLAAIGRIHSPHKHPIGTPIQPVYAAGAAATVVLDASFTEGLDDIEGFERLWLVYLFDRITKTQLKVIPYRDIEERGIFATRAPCRPNRIGLSAVRLSRREGNVLHVVDIDVLDGTPLLDIKPYIPEYDSHPESRGGWVQSQGTSRKVADSRFHASDEPTSD